MKRILALLPAGLLIIFCLFLANLPEDASARNQAQLDTVKAGQSIELNETKAPYHKKGYKPSKYIPCTACHGGAVGDLATLR